MNHVGEIRIFVLTLKKHNYLNRAGLFRMDVICVVNTSTGVLHSTEFYVKFKSTLIDEGAAAIFGMNEDSNAHQSSNVFPNETKLEEELAVEKQQTNQVAPPEADWVDIICNKNKCEGVIAFIGVGKLLHFYDPVTQKYSLTPSESMLKSFSLEFGKNVVVCWHRATGIAKEFNIWKFNADERLVIMDIDGTVTKSDITGYITTVYLGVYSHVHEGVVSFLNVLRDSYRYNVVYLSSRPMIHRKETKQLLNNIKDEFGLSMPDGPLFTNKERILFALYREITKNTVEFKSLVLHDIAEVFRIAGSRTISPYALGIGNKEADAIAYNSAGLAAECILLIDTASQIYVWKYSAQIKKAYGNRGGWIEAPITPGHIVTTVNDNRVTFKNDAEGNEDDTVNDEFNQDASALATAEVRNESYKVKFNTYKDENLLRYITRVATDQRHHI